MNGALDAPTVGLEIGLSIAEGESESGAQACNAVPIGKHYLLDEVSGASPPSTRSTQATSSGQATRNASAGRAHATGP